MKGRYLTLAGAATLLSGCMPADVRPPASAAVVAPAAWRDGVAAAGSIAPDWWRAFGDPVLDRLIEDALARNTDILVAAARVQEAQADIRTARSALLPAIDAVGAGQYARAPGASGLATSTAFQPELQANW